MKYVRCRYRSRQPNQVRNVLKQHRILKFEPSVLNACLNHKDYLHVMPLNTFSLAVINDEKFRRTKTAVSKSPCLTFSNVVFRQQNFIGSQPQLMVSPTLLAPTTHTQTHPATQPQRCIRSDHRHMNFFVFSKQLNNRQIFYVLCFRSVNTSANHTPCLNHFPSFHSKHEYNYETCRTTTLYIQGSKQSD